MRNTLRRCLGCFNCQVVLVAVVVIPLVLWLAGCAAFDTPPDDPQGRAQRWPALSAGLDCQPVQFRRQLCAGRPEDVAYACRALAGGNPIACTFGLPDRIVMVVPRDDRDRLDPHAYAHERCHAWGGDEAECRRRD